MGVKTSWFVVDFYTDKWFTNLHVKFWYLCWWFGKQKVDDFIWTGWWPESIHTDRWNAFLREVKSWWSERMHLWKPCHLFDKDFNVKNLLSESFTHLHVKFLHYCRQFAKYEIDELVRWVVTAIFLLGALQVTLTY